MNSTPDRVTIRRRFGTGTVARVLAGGIAAGSVVGLFATAGPAAAAPEKVHKSYVCKYVDKPGEAERLQTGNNPIWVDNHALFPTKAAYDAANGLTVKGQAFKDGQIKSVVIVPNTMKLNPEPSVADCPPPAPPTTTTSTSSTSATSATLIPPKTPSTITATLIPPKTPVTPPTTTTTTPATVVTLYPLQPVKAGVVSDATTSEFAVTPLRMALVLLVLLGLWVAFGGRLPHLRRVETPNDDS